MKSIILLRFSSRCAAGFFLTVLSAWFSSSGADFFVSPYGRDASSGSTPREPWRSLERVNEHIRQHGLWPGDAIRLRGGSAFKGGLVIDKAGGGCESNRVFISTYGKGRARILAEPGTAILVRETSWLTISNLDLLGTLGGQGDGIRCDRTRESRQPIPGIEIRDCTISGFAWHGIMVDAAQRSYGFERVRVEGCVASKNRYAGIMVYGGNPAGRTWRPHSQITVVNCETRENAGDPDEFRHHSGNGILLDGVDGGVIRGCVASENGRECRNERGGPVGIWAHASRRVVIEHCESHDNRSCLKDGGGFDLDGGCEECVVRFNFSHHNHGPGFLVYTYAGAAYANRSNQVCGNISWNDGVPGSRHAGIQIGSEPGCAIQALEVFNNVVVAPPRSVAALKITGHSITATIRSNLVVASDHGILASIEGYDHAIRFVGNRYWRPDGKPVFLVDYQWTISSLQSWHNANVADSRFTSDGESFGDFGLSLELPKRPRGSPSVPVWPNVRFGGVSQSPAQP